MGEYRHFFYRNMSQSMQSTSDPRNREVVYPAGNPQVGNLATPINASKITKAFINNLPAYRKGLLPQRRGLEIGMAHGYFLFGPFAWTNPLRGTQAGNFLGLLEAATIIVILTFALSLYATVLDENKPVSTITTPHPPEAFSTREGWRNFATGFLVGGKGGAIFAYLVYQIFM